MHNVDHNQPPPPQLVTAWNCKRWNTLPEGGGYFDQPYMLMTEMSAVHNVYNALAKVRASTGAEIHNLTPGERKILAPLVKQGLI